MLLYISILGIFLSFVLLYFNARRYSSTIYLAVFCLVLSLYSLNLYIILYSKSEFWISLVFCNITFLSYLIGPMCYFYTRSLLTDHIRLRKTDLWHFLPTFFYLFASIPYIITPFSYKREIARAIISDSGFLGSFHATFLSDLFTNATLYLSRPILAFLYVLGSIGLLVYYNLNKGKGVVLSRRHFIYKWLLFFLGTQLLLVSSHLLVIFNVFQNDMGDLFFTLNLFQIFSFIGLAGLLITPFFFLRILYRLPGFVTGKIQSEFNDIRMNSSEEAKKISLNFEFDYMISIVQKMATCMQEQKPYLKPDFNLAQFSVMLQVPAHHLAYFFREIKKQSFNDYRNECRVHHSKVLILEGKSNNLTLEAIGTLSGFTNRNTFFTAFKKVEGMAPSNWVIQQFPDGTVIPVTFL